MRINNKEQLKSIMDLHKINYLPIFYKGKEMGGICNSDKGLSYVEGDLDYFISSKYAYEEAYKQIDDFVSLINRANVKTSAVIIEVTTKRTYVYADEDGGVPYHHVYPNWVDNKKEINVEGTLIEIFKHLFDLRRHFCYCNDTRFSFNDKELEKDYQRWICSLSYWEVFDMNYPNNTIVD